MSTAGTALTAQSATEFEQVVASGGVAIFPTDTLYGIACDPDGATALNRIHELKGRPPRKPSAVMWFALEHLLADVGAQLEPPVRELVEQLLPGPFTLVVANHGRRFLPSCAGTPEMLGLRVPQLDGPLAPLAAVGRPVAQTSANRSGAADPVDFAAIEPAIHDGVDLALDAGAVSGLGSTVADISELPAGRWRLLREPRPGSGQIITDLVGREPEE